MNSPYTLTTLAAAIDEAADNKDIAGLAVLDAQALLLQAQSLTPREVTLLIYCRSNIQASLQDFKAPQSWLWRQEHRERQILYLRQARSHAGFNNLYPLEKARIITNLANSLSSLGRSIEALELYDEALVYEPQFAMALGNRGVARFTLARALHDTGHGLVIAVAAYDDLFAASSKNAIWDYENSTIKEYFRLEAIKINTAINVEATRKTFDLTGFSLGRSSTEKNYRLWCLQQHLFINPLNVIGAYPIAATDSLGLPSHITGIDEPPHFIAWFNLLKQEFSAARLFCFEGATMHKAHFSDHGLRLIDTFDYQIFSLNTEKTKIAFRLAYGLLDKIAGFINVYFDLKMPADKVSIRHVWRQGKTPLREELQEKPNLYLRGLYWLAMDIVGDVPEDQDSIAPDAAHLHSLRNALEHRCLVLRIFGGDKPMGIVEAEGLDSFRTYTLQLLKLVRAALIYLPLAVQQEEIERSKSNNAALTMPVKLPIYRPQKMLELE